MTEELKATIAALVGFLVTQGLKRVGEWLGLDLSGPSAAIAAALVTACVLFLDALVNAIPQDYRQAVLALLGLLASVLSTFGIYKTVYKNAKR